MELGLKGRTAFVAAASSGIGRGVALALAAEGCDVGLCARTADTLETVAMQVREAGVRAVPTVADVTDPAGLREGRAGNRGRHRTARCAGGQRRRTATRSVHRGR